MRNDRAMNREERTVEIIAALLTVILIVLKLVGLAHIHWVWVFYPLWGTAVIGLTAYYIGKL